jgi:glyoxylase-like metal-dependent hydrolase (beta-lactamase superfamily II)
VAPSEEAEATHKKTQAAAPAARKIEVFICRYHTYSMPTQDIGYPAEPRITRHPDGITAVDAEYIRVGLAAAHIIQEKDRAAVVDTGTNDSIPYLLNALEQLGVKRNAVDYVFLTHVHLDHAGGAGLLLQALPNAKAVVHPRGAPHLMDPGKLVAASKLVYGESLFKQLYGELVPIPVEHVITAEDGQKFSLAGRELETIHTPGHALHHFVLVDGAHGNVFTGDTFGLSYRETDTDQGAFIVPTSTPSQFDPDQLIASIDRIMSYSPRAAYLTHFSRVTNLPVLAESLKRQIHDLVRIAKRHAGSPNMGPKMAADIRALWLRLAREHGVTLSDEQIDAVLGQDIELNVQGLEAWLKRLEAQK